jgi:hypothetical protein
MFRFALDELQMFRFALDELQAQAEVLHRKRLRNLIDSREYMYDQTLILRLGPG